MFILYRLRTTVSPVTPTITSNNTTTTTTPINSNDDHHDHNVTRHHHQQQQQQRSHQTKANTGQRRVTQATVGLQSLRHDVSEGGSLPPSRPTSQPASRSGSMSAGVGGGKVVVPQPVHVPSWRERRGSKPEVVPATPSRKPSVNSDKGEGLSHRFNLKDLLANGPKLNRKSSTSSRRSDSDTGEGKAKSIGGDSAVSLTQKYGVCQKVAIGKGATSVVRLAHKWDRTEEKLYAVKVNHSW
jgi:hypothetical protein